MSSHLPAEHFHAPDALRGVYTAIIIGLPLVLVFRFLVLGGSKSSSVSLSESAGSFSNHCSLALPPIPLVVADFHVQVIK